MIRSMAVVSLVACIVTSSAGARDLSHESVPGTYELLVCQRSCPAAGDVNVLVRGRLVLLAASLEEQEVAQFASAHGYISHESHPNGCFALNRVEDPEKHGTPGNQRAGLTRWSVIRGALNFSLIHSPDVGYALMVMPAPKGFSGKGYLMGGGMGAPPPKGRGPDVVVIRRVGKVDRGLCR
jgi:hypothetical protein